MSASQKNRAFLTSPKYFQKYGRLSGDRGTMRYVSCSSTRSGWHFASFNRRILQKKNMESSTDHWILLSEGMRCFLEFNFTKLICQQRLFQLRDAGSSSFDRHDTIILQQFFQDSSTLLWLFFSSDGLIWRTRVLLVHWQTRGESFRNFAKHVASGANPRDGAFAGAARLPWDVG